MTPLVLEVSGATGSTAWLVLRMEGPFDIFAAQSLADRLRGETGTQRVVVDFSRTTAVQDVALEILARLVREHGPHRIMVRGLANHPERILRYLGVDPPPPAGGPLRSIK